MKSVTLCSIVVAGADVLPNPNGSAVGMMVEIEGKYLVILPGPPRENQPMFNDFVFGRLRDKAGEFFTARRVLRVAGFGESALDEAIAPIYTSYPTVQTSILFNRSEVEVHLLAEGGSDEEALAIVDELARKIIEKLGIAVFAANGETMEEVIGQMLLARDETISTAESCTGGLIAMRLTEISGSSAYFIEGTVTYSNESKTRLLGVSPEMIEAHGAVSAETAEAMAQGMRERAGTTYAVSVTGVAGPIGGTEEKPVGTVFIGYSDEERTKSIKFVLPGDRYLIRWRASQAALDYLRRQILKK